MCIAQLLSQTPDIEKHKIRAHKYVLSLYPNHINKQSLEKENKKEYRIYK